jgi:tRNA(Ile2) C34 agmatinyltransferase TiaS
MNNGLIGTVTQPQGEMRSRWRRKPAAKIRKVARVVVDQTAFCPECSDPMHLLQNHVFECSHCGHQIAAERAIEAIETARPNQS